jgi:CO/xanthine dehydrogenase FAD-binding subunit
MTQEYFSPMNVSETLILLRKSKGRAKLIAGGTSVIPAIRTKVIKRGQGS